MASLLRVLAAKPYTSVLRRSFAVLATKPTQEVPDATSSSNDLAAPSFETLRGVIDDNTLKAIKHTHMSPVQARIFPLLPDFVLPYNPATPRSTGDPKDLLVKAKTGTGKTMGFLIPAIEARLKALNAHFESSVGNAGVEVTPRFKAKAIHNYAAERAGTLIVSPTRELATQIAVEAATLTKHHLGFQIRVLLGGESKNRQIREWQQGRKDIVVCTPGRILDLLESQPDFSAALKYTQMVSLFFSFIFGVPLVRHLQVDYL
jgi:ATP-dependent RNA helicase MSS116, mitochondrial